MIPFVKIDAGDYVVAVIDDGQEYPLRNFGKMQSAAKEFCTIIKDAYRYFGDAAERRIKGYRDSYVAAQKFTYPEVRRSGVILKKQ